MLIREVCFPNYEKKRNKQKINAPFLIRTSSSEWFHLGLNESKNPMLVLLHLISLRAIHWSFWLFGVCPLFVLFVLFVPCFSFSIYF
jgi:hypothetical protein